MAWVALHTAPAKLTTLYVLPSGLRGCHCFSLQPGRQAPVLRVSKLAVKVVGCGTSIMFKNMEGLFPTALVKPGCRKLQYVRHGFQYSVASSRQVMHVKSECLALSAHNSIQRCAPCQHTRLCSLTCRVTEHQLHTWLWMAVVACLLLPVQTSQPRYGTSRAASVLIPSQATGLTPPHPHS